MAPESLLDDLGRRLDERASPRTKAWWDRYLKGSIEFRGVPMAGIREAVHAWHSDHGLESDELRAAALALLTRSPAEDKLAGILVMQELLLPSGAMDHARDLDALASLFDAGHIADWNTCDWLCVRVLGPLVEAQGAPAAKALAAWVEAPGLWRRRAAGVGFVNLAGRGDTFFSGLVDLLLEVAEVLVADAARFSQTAAGWLLRELSEASPDRTFAFVLAHRSAMSGEAVRMAAARLQLSQRSALGLTGKPTRR